MKKTLLFTMFSLLSFLFVTAQDTTFTEMWSFYGETAPAWFTDGTEIDLYDPSFSGVERGIAYSDYSGHVYVSSRHGEDTDQDGSLDWGEPHVYILDPETGQAPAFGLSQLITTDINSAHPEAYGGGYPLNNVVTTVDGSILACNMTLASGPDIVTDDGTTVKAFRVYRWDWEQGQPQLVVDHKTGGYRLGDKFSVIGNWETDATIYAGAGGTNKILSWSVSEGIVAEEPVIIELQDIDNAATSPTVAPSITNDDWFYVSGRGFMPTLFTKEGVNLTQVAISVADFPGTPLAGRTIRCGGRNYMAMFSDNQSAFIFDITNNGENVTDADVLGFTPAFGTEYEGAYGEGAVDFGIIEDQLYVFICGPSNGLACFKVNGVLNTSVEKRITDSFQVSAYPNPATEFANIQFTLPRDANGAVAVKLFDMSGKFMGITADEAQGGPQEMRISTSQLSPGQYIYQVVYKNEISTGKLLTQ